MRAKYLMTGIKTDLKVILGYIKIIPLFSFLLLVFTIFSIIYFQQSSKQEELTQQISTTSRILSKPAPDDERLRLQYEEINQSVSSLTIDVTFQKIVSIAGVSGIDVGPDGSKLLITNFSLGTEKIGETNYSVYSFRDVKVLGEHDKVMAFITNLDSGNNLKTLVMKKVTLSQAGLENEIVASLDFDVYSRSN